MLASQIPSAVSAARAIAAELGLSADEAVIIQASNRIAVRLLPCDVLARVAVVTHREHAALEIEVARRLAETRSPVATPEPRAEPRVYERDGFVVTLWTWYESLPAQHIAPTEYAGALEALHRGMSEIDLPAPHFTDRIAEAQQLITNPELTPELGGPDRELLSSALHDLSAVCGRPGTTQQLLHGEPHPGNLLQTRNGLLFVDFETVCRGPVEFDIAHCGELGGDRWHIGFAMPDAVSRHYRGADPELVRDCWTLMLAMVAAWRWDRTDQFPDGRRMGIELIEHLRAARTGTGQARHPW